MEIILFCKRISRFLPASFTHSMVHSRNDQILYNCCFFFLKLLFVECIAMSPFRTEIESLFLHLIERVNPLKFIGFINLISHTHTHVHTNVVVLRQITHLFFVILSVSWSCSGDFSSHSHNLIRGINSKVHSNRLFEIVSCNGRKSLAFDWLNYFVVSLCVSQAILGHW